MKHDDDLEWDWGFIAFFIAILVIPLILTALVAWGALSYGQRWENCSTDHGDFQFFSAKCLDADQ